MSRAADKVEVLPPKGDTSNEKTSPQFNEDGNPIIVEVVSKSGTSKTPILEDLMKKLDKLKTDNKKLKAKGKKGATYSYSSKDVDSSFEEEWKKQAR
jgi:hypothetical protein